MTAIPQTHIYKTTPDCDIHLDVYQTSPGSALSPCVVWIHGGNMTGGSRRGVHPKVLELGYTVVAIDYRLAPEAKLPEITADIGDAFTWVRERGARLHGIDPDLLAVVGHSAGGYLALISGNFLPRPRALVSFYGFGDITDEWATTPKAVAAGEAPVTRDQAFEGQGGPPISDCALRTYDIGPFDAYCVQQGLWPQVISGRDPLAEPDFFRAYCPIRNVTGEYPPTLLLHGDCDASVPHEQSATMAEELARHNVATELVTIEGGLHSFDRLGPPHQGQHAWGRVGAFLNHHLAPEA